MSNAFLFTSESVSEGPPRQDCRSDLGRRARCDPRASDTNAKRRLPKRWSRPAWPWCCRARFHCAKTRAWCFSTSRRSCPFDDRAGHRLRATRTWVSTAAFLRRAECAIGKQSPGHPPRAWTDPSAEEQGAGDQGLMFGYATNETDVLMPAPITFSHRLVQPSGREVRKSRRRCPGCCPDAKSQVTFRLRER